jgi:hypothetical protein
MKHFAVHLLVLALISTACSTISNPSKSTGLDTSFGSQGSISFTATKSFKPLVLQSTEKIVGYTFDATKPEDLQVHELARLDANGQFDSSFKSGTLLGSRPEDEIIKLPDDSLLRLDVDALHFTSHLEKFTADGLPVSSYGRNGGLILPFASLEAQQTCVDPRNGNLVLPFANISPVPDLPPDGRPVMARVTPDGQMPGEFGFPLNPLGNGFVSRCAISATGNVAIGISPRDRQFWSEGILSYSSDGARIPSYGTSLDGDGSQQTMSVAIFDSNQRLLVAATDGISSGIYFGRLIAEGQDDQSFVWSAFFDGVFTSHAKPRLLNFLPTTRFHSVTNIFPLQNGVALVGVGSDKNGWVLQIAQLKTNGDFEKQFNQTGKYIIPQTGQNTLPQITKKVWAALNSAGQVLAFSNDGQGALYRINLAP